MSNSRPIHFPPREIRTQPHESEPPHSYSSNNDDVPSALLDEEDDFHNKLSRSSRRESSGGTGGSFWRTSDDRPSFNSVNVNHPHKKSSSPADAGAARSPPQQEINRTNRSTGLLGTAIQGQNHDPLPSVSKQEDVIIFEICRSPLLTRKSTAPRFLFVFSNANRGALQIALAVLHLPLP